MISMIIGTIALVLMGLGSFGPKPNSTSMCILLLVAVIGFK